MQSSKIGVGQAYAGPTRSTVRVEEILGKGTRSNRMTYRVSTYDRADGTWITNDRICRSDEINPLAPLGDETDRDIRSWQAVRDGDVMVAHARAAAAVLAREGISVSEMPTRVRAMSLGSRTAVEIDTAALVQRLGGDVDLLASVGLVTTVLLPDLVHLAENISGREIPVPEVPYEPGLTPDVVVGLAIGRDRLTRLTGAHNKIRKAAFEIQRRSEFASAAAESLAAQGLASWHLIPTPTLSTLDEWEVQYLDLARRNGYEEPVPAILDGGGVLADVGNAE